MSVKMTKVIVRSKDNPKIGKSLYFLGTPTQLHVYLRLKDDDLLCPFPIDGDGDVLKCEYDNVTCLTVTYELHGTHLTKLDYAKETLRRPPDRVLDIVDDPQASTIKSTSPMESKEGSDNAIRFKKYIWTDVPKFTGQELIAVIGGFTQDPKTYVLCDFEYPLPDIVIG